MARVVCLSDTVSLVRLVREEVTSSGHLLVPLPGSRLNDALRQAVRQAAPDVVLFELTNAIDNPHIYFFLRSDQATRHLPVIFLSSRPDLDLLAPALGADGYLHLPLERSALHRTLSIYLDIPAPASAPRIEIPRPSLQRYAALMQRPSLVARVAACVPA
ncbi:MAG: response regulator [Roseiflexus sp.]|nr:response regulator [Roseiflexus sp.]MCS7289636.1 response regulator [Roseiflexus sp.]MDW8146601.1 response regulator [Roseiflexaceae bacterium]MDW8232855.1 response regulator [Roseiflexaceae bacterium]